MINIGIIIIYYYYYYNYYYCKLFMFYSYSNVPYHVTNLKQVLYGGPADDDFRHEILTMSTGRNLEFLNLYHVIWCYS